MSTTAGMAPGVTSTLAAPTVEARVEQDLLRAAVWPVLRAVARPHPTLGFAFDDFIADFAGSDRCAAAVRGLDAYRAASTVFVTPDESTEQLRGDVLADGKVLVLTTYGIEDGFRRVTPEDLPDGGPAQAATMAWLTGCRPRVELRDLAGAEIGLLVTGAGAVTPSGVRMGKGHGYFDLEWAMLSEVGALATGAVVVGVVHDCQRVQVEVAVAEHDVPLDVVVTPSGVQHCTPLRTPGAVRWPLLTPERAASIPPLVELALLRMGVTTP